MTISDLMQSMAAAGAPMEAILIAVRAIEERDAAIEARRTAARDKKRRQRAAAGDCPGTVPGHGRDMAGTVAGQPAPSSPPLSSPQTPQQTPPLHPHPEGSDAPTRTRRASWPKSCPPPPGVSEDQWAGFVAHRKAKRQPLTDRAYQLLVAKLADLADDGHPPGEMIDRAVERGWTTVFPPDEKRNGSAHHDRPSAWAPRHGLDGVEPASLDD